MVNNIKLTQFLSTLTGLKIISSKWNRRSQRAHCIKICWILL